MLICQRKESGAIGFSEPDDLFFDSLLKRGYVELRPTLYAYVGLRLQAAGVTKSIINLPKERVAEIVDGLRATIVRAKRERTWDYGTRQEIDTALSDDLPERLRGDPLAERFRARAAIVLSPVRSTMTMTAEDNLKGIRPLM